MCSVFTHKHVEGKMQILNVWIPIEISLKFVSKGSIDNIPALAKIMVWRRAGDKPLSEPLMVRLLTRHSASMS